MRLTESEVEHIDQFIFRFTKLQDAMRKRLIPITYQILEPEKEEASFIDILNKLEKLKNYSCRRRVAGVPFTEK